MQKKVEKKAPVLKEAVNSILKDEHSIKYGLNYYEVLADIILFMLSEYSLRQRSQSVFSIDGRKMKSRRNSTTPILNGYL